MKRRVKRLELHVSNHCNLSCRGCSHLSPLETTNFIDEDITLRSMEILKSLLTCDTIHLLGGEPLLYPNIAEFVYKIRKVGIANKVTIATNGLLIDKMDMSFWKAIDEANVSIYKYGKSTIDKIYEYATNISRVCNTEFNIYHFCCFREAYTENDSTDYNLTKKVYQSCVVAHNWECFNLYEDYFFKCPQAWALAKHLDCGGYSANGIRIITDKGLEQMLSDYLNNREPLPTCAHCLGVVGRKIPLQQVAQEEQWRKYQQKPYESMIDMEFMDTILQNSVANVDDIDTVKCTYRVQNGHIMVMN